VRKSVARSWLGIGTRKKGQDRKKVINGLNLRTEASTEAIYIKICLVGDVLNVITCAKFQNEIFTGYDFTGGRNFHFPTDF